jgi:hypothetical protein
VYETQIFVDCDKREQQKVLSFTNNTENFIFGVPLHYEVSGYGLEDKRRRFDPRQRRKDFLSSLCVQTGSGVHPASCTMGTGGLFPGAKAGPGRDADHSPPSSAEVENEYELYFLSPTRLRGM